MPMSLNNASKCALSGEVARGAIQGWLARSVAVSLRFFASGCTGAHHDGQRIVEQMFLHDAAADPNVS